MTQTYDNTPLKFHFYGNPSGMKASLISNNYR